MDSIEDIILGNDLRGVAALRQYLSEGFCDQAARFAMAEPGTVLIATGFYISMGRAPETDGPPGALALGRALEALGKQVVYVSDRYTVPLLRPFLAEGNQVVDFPISDLETSSLFAEDLLSRFSPSLLISIERCGPTVGGLYLNMRGVDISAHTARVDLLFSRHSRTIGIGDGGNEIGMGNLAPHIAQVGTLVSDPATSGVTHLIISSTSNWGGYGLAAALSRLAGRNLLPDPGEEEATIRRMVDLGAVDGVIGVSQYSVDAMSLEEHGQALVSLHQLLATDGIPS